MIKRDTPDFIPPSLWPQKSQNNPDLNTIDYTVEPDARASLPETNP